MLTFHLVKCGGDRAAIPSQDHRCSGARPARPPNPPGDARRAASLHDLYLATGIPKATLTRILHTCHRAGLVWQRLADGPLLASVSHHWRAPQEHTERLPPRPP